MDINRSNILNQIQEVLNILKHENKNYNEYYNLFKGHNYNKEFFDFNYKDLCLTLNKDLKLVGNVEIYVGEQLYSTEDIEDFLRLKND